MASLTMPVSVLDHDEPASPTGLLNRASAERAMKRIERKGFVDGRELSASLAWLRPIDSIWWAWVERYLLAADIPQARPLPLVRGHDQPARGAGARPARADAREPAHRPGALTVLGTPVDLRQVKADAYLIAGLTDNLTPWRSCYRTAALLGSSCRFVLVRGGHLQAILRPPGGRAGGFRTRTGTPRRRRRLAGRRKRPRRLVVDALGQVARTPLDRRSARRSPPRTSFGPAPGNYVSWRLDQLRGLTP